MKSIAGRHAPLVIACALLTASGCQREPSANATMAAPTAANAAMPFAFKEIRMGSDADNASRPEPVTTQDPVIVTISTVGQPKDSLLTARLLFLGNGQAVGSKELRLSNTTPSPIELRFEPSSNRMPGRYLLEIKLDDQLAAQRDLDIVEKPPESPKQ